MKILDYLNENILLTDGAMGTYYSEVTGDDIYFCEFANIKKPEIITQIHREYIEAGAKLIRTNTFSANIVTLDTDRKTVADILQSGYRIALEAVGDNDVFVGCSIGPIHESIQDKEDIDIYEEYKFVVDKLLEVGADIFIFETFGTVDYLEQISRYIKDKNPEAFVLAQFAVTMDGFTRKGIGLKSLLESVRSIDTIDIYGFNCGSGPTHLYKALRKADVFEDTISVLPNASYPEFENGRMVYVNNPDYFSDIIMDIVNEGAKIVGGCCGTRPEHIKSIYEKLNMGSDLEVLEKKEKKTSRLVQKKSRNRFLEKLKNDEFVLAVELDPPFGTDIDHLMNNARICKDEGIDLVTVADSPRGIARVDSMMIASKVIREVGIDAMPHLCCRDKNSNALKSGLLGAHVDDIRNILAITGDPVLDIDKMSTKSVFNFNSYELIGLISEMNDEIFKEDSMLISGALNLNVKNKEAQLNRLKKKAHRGAKAFFTQPIFEDDVIEFIKKMEKSVDIKVIAGIMPIVTYKNALFLNNEVPGIHIPERYVDMFEKSVDKVEAESIGIDIAVDMVEKIRKHVDGLYFITPFGRMDIIQKILERIR